MSDLLTRKQVIDLWTNQTPDLLNSFVCPDCRDVLSREPDENIPYGAHLVCNNSMCDNLTLYSVHGEIWSE